MKACFGFCPSRAGLGHEQTKQLPLAIPTTLLLAARLPRGHVPAPPPTTSSSFFILHNCKSLVLGDQQSLSRCEGSKSSQCSGSRKLRKTRRQSQSSPMGMASPPTSVVLPEAGCGTPYTDAVVMPGTVALLLAFAFSFSPLFLFLWTGVAAIREMRWSPSSSKESHHTGTLRGFFSLLVP